MIPAGTDVRPTVINDFLVTRAEPSRQPRRQGCNWSSFEPRGAECNSMFPIQDGPSVYHRACLMMGAIARERSAFRAKRSQTSLPLALLSRGGPTVPAGDRFAKNMSHRTSRCRCDGNGLDFPPQCGVMIRCNGNGRVSGLEVTAIFSAIVARRLPFRRPIGTSKMEILDRWQFL